MSYHEFCDAIVEIARRKRISSDLASSVEQVWSCAVFPHTNQAGEAPSWAIICVSLQVVMSSHSPHNEQTWFIRVVFPFSSSVVSLT